jgi:hypothetical protein
VHFVGKPPCVEFDTSMNIRYGGILKLALIAKNLEFLTFNFIINFYYCSNSKVLNSLEK